MGVGVVRSLQGNEGETDGVGERGRAPWKWKSCGDKEAGRIRFARSGGEGDPLERPREGTTPREKERDLVMCLWPREGNRVYDLLKVRGSCMYT